MFFLYIIIKYNLKTNKIKQIYKMNKTKQIILTRIQIDSKSPKSLSKEAEKILKNPQFEY
jgi:hypothetical protein